MTDDGGKQKFFADQVDYDTETRLMVATGNVVYTSPQTRIAAEKLEFDLDTKVGTFYNATGSSYLGDKVDKSFFGTQEPDALFYGEVIEKVGPKRYKITRGGFTSCVQPTPRWELVSSTSTGRARRIRPAEEHGAEGEGRADVLPAGDVLPDPGRRSRHRVPAADVRLVDRARAEHQQRVLLGDQPQPGRDDLPRLVHQARPGAGRRVSLRGRHRARRATSRPTT